MSKRTGLNRMHGRMRVLQEMPTLIWYGVTIVCSVNQYTRKTELTVGGHEVDVDISFGVSKRDFLTVGDTMVSADSQNPTSDYRPYPKAGLKLSFSGTNYKVVSVSDPVPNSSDSILLLHCASMTK